MQKSALIQCGETIFQSKVIPLFLPKCSKLHSFYYGILYTYMEVTVDFLPYMEVTVGKEKKRQNVAKYGGHRNSQNNNFKDSYLNIEKEFHYTYCK